MKRVCLSLCGVVLATGCGGSSSSSTDGPPGFVDAPIGDAFVPTGDPIMAPDNTWTWVPFPESVCRNGSSAGVAVNLNSASDNVFIYLQGGGACFNQFTCFGNPNSFTTADFNSLATNSGNRGVFSRTPNNPMADWNYVFIPYCSGDIHAGNTESGAIGEPQKGYVNIGHYLQRLVPTFANASTIVLGGSSAGGFGSAYNFDRFKRAFGPSVAMHLVDDSGPPLGTAYMTPCFQEQVRGVWNLDSTLPPDCPDCAEQDGSGLNNIAPYLATKYPQSRFGIISSTQDGTIRTFFSFGYPDCVNPDVTNYPGAVYEEGVLDLANNILGPYSNAHMFVISSSEHVWLNREPLSSVTSGGTALTDWLAGLINGTSDFHTVTP